MDNVDVVSNILVSNNEGGVSVLNTSEGIEQVLLMESVVYETTENCSEYTDDSEELKSLLSEFNLIQLLRALQSSNVTYRCLQYIQKEDLVEVIPHLGLRVGFREKLFMWRKKEFGIDDETISNPSKIKGWLNRDSPNVSSPPSCNSSVKRVLNIDLADILNRTSKGQSCLELYNQVQKLSNSNQDDIINIII